MSPDRIPSRSSRRWLACGLGLIACTLAGLFLWCGGAGVDRWVRLARPDTKSWSPPGRSPTSGPAGRKVPAITENAETLSYYFSLASTLLSRAGIVIAKPLPSQADSIRLRFEPATPHVASEVSLFCARWVVDIDPLSENLTYFSDSAVSTDEDARSRQAAASGVNYASPCIRQDEAELIAEAADDYRVFGRPPGLQFRKPEIVFKPSPSSRGWCFILRREHDGIPFWEESISFTINDHTRRLTMYSSCTTDAIPPAATVKVSREEVKPIVASFFTDKLPSLSKSRGAPITWNEGTFVCEGLKWIHANPAYVLGGGQTYSLDFPLRLAYVCKVRATSKNCGLGYEFWISAEDGSIIGCDHSVVVTVSGQ